ncbi:MHS family MFS transporter [Micrococcales bacterium 31B]|nr:MHS family MFS transporter [Micrococcales bacterium 31B]
MATPTMNRTHEERRVLAGTLVGTTIEWYDFFIYAQAAAVVFGGLFFAPLGETGAQIASWASLGISFLFRPLGAIVAGHLGDKIGRKKMLVMTLIMMGLATSLIGVLPSHAQIGIGAPILLVLLRIIQGFSAGGEWGGAALMSVEHAPANKRGLFGAYPQIGVPIGMILATGTMYALTSNLTEAQFLDWGWRVPFLFSIVLIFVGYLIRRSVEESPVFLELQQRKSESAAPLSILFKNNSREVWLTALIFISNNAAGYLLIAFFVSYVTKATDMPRPTALLITTLSSFGWLIFTMYGGWLSDRIGRVRTFQIGYVAIALWSVPMWFLIDSGDSLQFFVALFVLTIGLGLSYGPQSALYAEMFPADVRYSGVSIGYALGAILGGAFAPLIAQFLLDNTGKSWSIGVYVLVITLISLGAVSVVKETRGAPLDRKAGESA